MLFYPRLVSDAKTYRGVEGRRGNHKQRRKEKIIKSLQWTKKQVKDEGNHKMPCNGHAVLGCCRIYQPEFSNYTTEAKEIKDEGSTT